MGLVVVCMEENHSGPGCDKEQISQIPETGQNTQMGQKAQIGQNAKEDTT